MKLKFVLLMGLAIIFSGCGNSDTNISKIEEKKDYNVTTQKIESFGNDGIIKKSGKLVGAQNITISSQANGKIKAIYKKQGDSVAQGELIAELSDSISNYKANMDNAKNSLDTAKLNYESNNITLNKTVKDSELAYEKAQQDFKSTQENVDEDLKKAQQDYETTVKNIKQNSAQSSQSYFDADYENSESQAKLSLEKNQKDLEKAKLDYQSLLNSNKETIEGFKNSLKSYNISLNSSYADIVLFSDKLLGITDENSAYNDAFQTYIGGKDYFAKVTAEDKLRSIISSKSKISGKDYSNIGEDKILAEIDLLNNTYLELDSFLDSMENVLKKSIADTSFPQSTIDAYISTVNGYQSAIQSNYAQITSFKNQVNSFLKSYKDSENSAQKNIASLEQQVDILQKNLESAKKNAEIGQTKTDISNESALNAAESLLAKTKISAENTLKTSEINLKNNKNNLDNVIANKDITLKSLQNAIDQANIQYSNAMKEYEKLFVKAPINGKISKISTDVGQDVNVGTPIAELVSDNKQEIDVSFNSTEISYLQVGIALNFEYNGNTYTGYVLSISNIADANLNYPVEISVNTPVANIGDYVNVFFPIKTDKLLLPVNYVNIENSDKGFIYTMSGEELLKTSVDLGKVWGDKIEILTQLEPNIDLVTTDMKNFDDKKFKIVIQK